MRDCIDFHRRYMSFMDASKGCRDPSMRRSLIDEALRWLDAWFVAVECELARNRRIAMGRPGQ